MTVSYTHLDVYKRQEYDLRGVDKRSTWFTTAKKKYLASPELGDFRNMLQISLYLARSVRRMHQAGLRCV